MHWINLKLCIKINGLPQMNQYWLWNSLACPPVHPKFSQLGLLPTLGQDLFHLKTILAGYWESYTRAPPQPSFSWRHTCVPERLTFPSLTFSSWFKAPASRNASTFLTRLLLSRLLKLSKFIDNSFRFVLPCRICSRNSCVCRRPKLTALRVILFSVGMAKTFANVAGSRSPCSEHQISSTLPTRNLD